MSVDDSGLTYDVQCKNEEKVRKAHYKQLKTWHGTWDEPSLQTTEDTNKGKTLPLRDNYGGIPPKQQLERGINFSEVFKGLDFSTLVNLNKTPQTTSSPATVVEVDLNRRGVAGNEEWHQLLPHSLQELLSPEIPSAQPPPPVPPVQLSEPRTSGMPINPPSSPADGQAEREEIIREQSPQMLTRARRRALTRLRTRSESSNINENYFVGFDADKGNLQISTPYRLNVLHNFLSAGKHSNADPRVPDNSEVSSESDPTISSCSTCGSGLHICNCAHCEQTDLN